MPNVGSFGGSVWEAVPEPGDAEALFGVVTQDAIVGTISLLLIGLVLTVSRAAVGTLPPDSLKIVTVQHHLSLTGPSRGIAVRAVAAHGKTQGLTRNGGQPVNRARDGRAPRFGSFGTPGRQAKTSPLGISSKANLERGPPMTREGYKWMVR
jgi:hypothetical protein